MRVRFQAIAAHPPITPLLVYLAGQPDVNIYQTISAAALASAGWFFKNPPISKFSSTVICGKTDLSWKNIGNASFSKFLGRG